MTLMMKNKDVGDSLGSLLHFRKHRKLHNDLLQRKNKAEKCFNLHARAPKVVRDMSTAQELVQLLQQKQFQSDTFNTWTRTQTVTYSSTNLSHCCLTLLMRWVLISLCHNS